MNNHFTASISLAVEANGTNQYLFDLIFICRSQQSDHVHYHPAEREFNRRFISISVTIAVFFIRLRFAGKCVCRVISIYGAQNRPTKKKYVNRKCFCFPLNLFTNNMHAVRRSLATGLPCLTFLLTPIQFESAQVFLFSHLSSSCKMKNSIFVSLTQRRMHANTFIHSECSIYFSFVLIFLHFVRLKW